MTTETTGTKSISIASIISCILAVVGIIFLGVVFIPLAAISAIIGSVNVFKNKNIKNIGINILAWILTFIGFFTSPVLLALIGFSSAATF